MKTTTFSNELKLCLQIAQNNYCRADRCLKKIHSFHHKLSNTKQNRLTYPLFINSPFNAVGLCFYHHDQKPHEFKITEKEAEIYEVWLKKLVK